MPFIVLLLLFTVLPFTELWLLIELGQSIGLLYTFLLVIGTGILGALAKQQGLQTLWKIRQQSASGQLPGDALFDGALILVAGAVLITPGMITDAIGFSLLVPPMRTLVKRSLKRVMKNRVQVFTNAPQGESQPKPRGDVIDVKVAETKVRDADER